MAAAARIRVCAWMGGGRRLAAGGIKQCMSQYPHPGSSLHHYLGAAGGWRSAVAILPPSASGGRAPRTACAQDEETTT